MIKSILLDLDETLIQSEEATKTLFETAKELFLKHSDTTGDELRQAYRYYGLQERSRLECFRNIEKVGCGSYDCFFTDEIFTVEYTDLHTYRMNVNRCISNELNLHEKLIFDISVFLKKKWLDYYSLYPDAIPFLNSLKKIRLFIATNGLNVIQKQKIDKFGLRNYFSDIFISQNLGSCKPNPCYFKSILTKIENRADDVIMIGDNLLSDIEGAHTHGMHTIHIKRSSIRNDKDVSFQPKYQIFNLIEAMKIMNDVFNFNFIPVV